jgi:hypothetical protein
MSLPSSDKAGAIGVRAETPARAVTGNERPDAIPDSLRSVLRDAVRVLLHPLMRRLPMHDGRKDPHA